MVYRVCVGFKDPEKLRCFKTTAEDLTLKVARWTMGGKLDSLDYVSICSPEYITVFRWASNYPESTHISEDYKPKRLGFWARVRDYAELTILNLQLRHAESKVGVHGSEKNRWGSPSPHEFFLS